MHVRSALWLLIVSVAACSSEATAPPPSMLVSTPVTAVTTTSIASSTTTTTMPEPTMLPTDPPPPTTTPDDAIRQAVQDYWAAYWLCGQSPATCDPSTFTAPGSASLTTASEFVASLIVHQLHFGSDQRGSYVRVERIDIGADEATTIECVYDAGTVLGPPASDGSPTVINDRISSARLRHTWVVVGGRWMVSLEDQFERIGEGDLCAGS